MVHAWVLVRSDRERAWKLLSEALESDLLDTQGGTTAEGVHLGAMAGTVDLVQRAFTGLETRDEVLWLDPSLPEELTRLRFKHPLPASLGTGDRDHQEPDQDQRAARRRLSDQGRHQGRDRRAACGCICGARIVTSAASGRAGVPGRVTTAMTHPGSARQKP